ncbi:hypothetical protein GGP41_009370 [Bipolaris sorokiniana]|uniref:Uncharacterized protein n=1 Tax=Cochliobolus sativus TaxID=45130 RepID=A0A8H5ZAE6_COCSA|nr:hypothetical protein GGP41_009370 [Bipolaris sorokiniana]
MRLPDRATAEEARIAAGYSDPQWRRFIDITKDVARELREKDPELRWRRVPYNRKCEITEMINTQLVGEGISAITIELVGWRMSRVIGNLKYAEAKSTRSIDHPIEINSATYAGGADGVTPAKDVHGAAVEGTRTFDPIRDI